jgi:hypothetical protein
MTWEIVLGLIALFSFMVAVVKPIVTLTKAITELTVTVKELKNYVNNFFNTNEKDHERILNHCEAQDSKIEDHEKRIIKMETKMENQEKE